MSVPPGSAPRTIPVIDRERCEARSTCVEVCPFDVFEVRRLEPQDQAALSLRGKLKAWAHGRRQAYVLRPDACEACALCVGACPEGAIRLARAV